MLSALCYGKLCSTVHGKDSKQYDRRGDVIVRYGMHGSVQYILRLGRVAKSHGYYRYICGNIFEG